MIGNVSLPAPRSADIPLRRNLSGSMSGILLLSRILFVAWNDPAISALRRFSWRRARWG
jgi:hypothetical protein